MANYLFDPNHLTKIASDNKSSYSSAAPFPHSVIDDLFSDFALTEILDVFPEPSWPFWRRYDPGKKLASTDEVNMPEKIRLTFRELNSPVFLSFLEQLTGIDGLIPDPYLLGGGLHQILPGGSLELHADFSRHPHLHVERRLNLLIYLNRNWKEQYGGALEFWDRELLGCRKLTMPLFNRTVVFTTTDFSFHGHPHRLSSPEHITRKSLALYYYTFTRPPGELAGDRISGSDTRYQERPLEPDSSLAVRARYVLRRWLPPALVEFYRRVRSKH